MALTPYKSQESSLNRSRSSSCSSPIRNRVLYQEIFSVGTSTLVRSYSCDQVVDKDDKGRTFQTTKIQFSSFITPEKEIRGNSPDPKVKKPRRLAVNLPTEEPVIIQKMDVKSKEPEKSTSFSKSIILFIFLVVITDWNLYFTLTSRECDYVWDLEKTGNELETSVFGQSQALLKINSVLKTSNSSNDIHIMLFTGGVGIGKTFSSSIISHNFPWSSNKLIIYSEYFGSDVAKLLSQKPSSCGCNLIIIDDLSVKATTETISLISLLNNKRKKNENFLIILIFQSHTEEERSEIVKQLENAYVNFNHVPFKPLTEEVVRKCFEAEIQRQQVEIPEAELKKLVKERMNPINISKGPTGCKGVTEDVASYLKKNWK